MAKKSSGTVSSCGGLKPIAGLDTKKTSSKARTIKKGNGQTGGKKK